MAVLANFQVNSSQLSRQESEKTKKEEKNEKMEKEMALGWDKKKKKKKKKKGEIKTGDGLLDCWIAGLLLGGLLLQKGKLRNEVFV